MYNKNILTEIRLPMLTCTYLHMHLHIVQNGWMDDLQFYVIFSTIRRHNNENRTAWRQLET